MELPHCSDLFKHYPPPLLRKILSKRSDMFDNVLFIIIVREPCAWLEAMQVNRYEFNFDDAESPCSIDLSAENYGVSYREHLQALGFGLKEVVPHFQFENILKYWSSYYAGAIDFMNECGALIVSYEEMLLRTPEFIYEVKSLLGRAGEATLMVPMWPSKTHGNAKGFLGARTSLLQQMNRDFTKEKALVRKHVDAKVLEVLGYHLDVPRCNDSDAEARVSRQNLFWTSMFKRMILG